MHSVDLLRGFTALFVGLYHFVFHHDSNGLLFEDGTVFKETFSILPSVVFIFFSLSGFVIAMSMHRNAFHLKKFGAFIARRWVRIEIPYIASIGVYLFIALLWSLKQHSSMDFDPLRFLHHLAYTIPYTDYHWYNDIYWTLAIEFQFYLTIALLFPLFISKNEWIRYGSLIAFSVLGLLVTDLRFVFRYAPMFAVGILMYFQYFTEDKRHWLTYPLIGLFLIQIGTTFDIPAALFILFSLVVMPLRVSEKNIMSRFGRMGYSFYLIHGAAGGSLIYFLAKDASGDFLKIGIVLAGVLVSLVACFVFYKLVEAPSIRWSKKVDFSTKEKSDASISE